MEHQQQHDVDMHDQHQHHHHDEQGGDAPPLGDQLMQHQVEAAHQAAYQQQQHQDDSMSYDTSYHAAAAAAAATAAAAAAAEAATAAVHQHQQQQAQAQQQAQESPIAAPAAPTKPKRAKPTGKITRNRPITSCLECRARKQKCDRGRPRCKACPEDSPCTYVDADTSARAAQEAATAILAAAAVGQRDPHQLGEEVRKRERIEEEQRRQKSKRNARAAEAVDASPTSTAARRALIAKTAALGKSKTLDFDNRVRAARSACIGAILFEAADPNSFAEAASDSPLIASTSFPSHAVPLLLPKPEELGELLDAYRDSIEPVFNAVIVDLNRLRILSFIKWWHSQPTTLPADPPLVPLVLVILALALQVKRTGSKAEALGPEERSATCDSEKRLIETAGRCIDALQIVCPSNWSSAFSAPLDLVRASMLRGLWHLGELHLQFASSCFATTIRLAHAAGLQRDATLWQSMGAEEAQARRNMWWCCASLEVTHSTRLHMPVSIARDSFDTQLPTDHGALLGLYARAEALQAQRLQASILSGAPTDPPNLLPRASRASFDFHYAKYSAAQVFIQDQAAGGLAAKDASSDSPSAQLLDSLKRWRDGLPETQQWVLRLDTGRLLGAEAMPPEEEAEEEELAAAALTSSFGEEANDSGDPTQGKRSKSEWLLKYEKRVRYVQRVMLRLMNLHATMHVHRPQFNEAGTWKPPGEAQNSLAECLDSAQRLVYLIWSFITGDPSPPFMLYNQLTHHLFQAAVILSIQSALCSPRTEDGAAFRNRARPVLDRAVASFDLLAEKPELRHVAEQAARYASTLREMDAAQAKRNAARTDGTDDAESVAAAAIAAATEAEVPKRSNAYVASSQGYSETGSEPVALAPPPPAQLPIHDPTANAASGSNNGYQVGPAEAPASDLNSSYGLEGALISEDWWRALDGSYSERSLMPGYAGASGSQGMSAGGSSSGAGGAFYYSGYGGAQQGGRAQHLPPTGLDLLASQVEQAPRAAQQGNAWQAQWAQPTSVIDELPATAPSLSSLGGVQHWQAAWQAWENYSERLTRDEL